jgi:cytidylate kinase
MEASRAIISIGRQAGSGGRAIGMKVAKELGIPFYDRELLTRAAKDSGMDEAVFQSLDEKPTQSLLYSLAMGTYTVGFPQTTYTEMPLDHRVFLAQFETIRKIAKEGSCVIVGRCADYALEGSPDLLSVFILADEEDRLTRLIKLHGLGRDEAKALMKKTDKKRAAYYDYYASRKWGSAATYNMCLNSSAFGEDGCVRLILEAVKNR